MMNRNVFTKEVLLILLAGGLVVLYAWKGLAAQDFGGQYVPEADGTKIVRPRIGPNK